MSMRNRNKDRNPLQSRYKRWFNKPEDGVGGGGGSGGGSGGTGDAAAAKVAADKAAAEAKVAADKAAADAKAAQEAAAKATAADKAALDKAAKDAQDAADKSQKSADAAKAAADKIAADLKTAADKAAKDAKDKAEEDPEELAPITLKTKDFKKIKDEAGRKALEKTAKEAGFDSAEAMVAAAKAAGNPSASKVEKQLADLQAKQAGLEAELAKTKIVAKIREAALSQGFVDSAYAENLAERQIAGKSADDAQAFDFKGYFGTMKKTHPHLFVATEVPADTGHTGKTTPAAVGAGDTKSAAGAAGQVDATKLTPEQYAAQKAQRFGSYPSA